MENKEKHTHMFMYLVSSFEMSAMMAMGKIKNPMTGETDRDLTQAQFSIDILDMLKEKASNNLDEYESKFLENVLGQLKLNYIDEAKKDKDKKDEGKKDKDKKDDSKKDGDKKDEQKDAVSDTNTEPPEDNSQAESK